MELRGFEPQLLPAEIRFDLHVRSVSFRFSTSRHLQLCFRVLTASRVIAPSRSGVCSMREHQIGVALYCALGTGLPIRGRISPLSAGGHDPQFS